MINSFSGKYRFLSNFYPCIIVVDGITYPTVEHCYQAMKTTDLADRATIAKLETPGQAKQYGRTVALRSDWEEIKLAVMESILRIKFEKIFFRNALKNTGNQMLVEGNYWGDKYWGMVDGKGQNNLGKILMKIRSEIN